MKRLVYLNVEQDKRVRQLARKEKTSVTEVIRRALEAYGRGEAAQAAADKRRAMKYVKAHPEGWADDPEEFFHG
ncbi:MAG: CopG family transcriptional regulator [Candidatus Baltobacteraceae bacterium]